MALPKTFTGGERLFAADLNDNFQYLDTAVGTTAFDAQNASNLVNGTLDSDRLPTIPTSKFPVGTIVQIQNLIVTASFSTASSTLINWPDMTLNITPTSANNKILVVAHVPRVQSSAGPHDPYFQILRAGSPNVAIQLARATNESTDRYDTLTVWRLDSPATTSEITYFAQVRRSGTGTATYQEGNITLFEIVSEA